MVRKRSCIYRVGVEGEGLLGTDNYMVHMRRDGKEAIMYLSRRSRGGRDCLEQTIIWST